MAKKKEKKDMQAIAPVVNLDQLKEFPGFDVANYNNLELSKKILSVHDIEKLIVTLRGVPVLIDRDLAFLYQVEVKQMNRQVKRNIERFPEDFMFQLTKKEYDDLKCQNGTSNDRGGDRRALPYAFTQQGIGMLSGLLRSQVAVETNIKIMRAFVGMQRYIAASMQIFQRLNIIELQQLETKHWMSVTNNKIEDILGKIEEISPKPLPEQLFPTGCVWDAWAYVSDLVRSAKNRIILIDNFVDDRVLSMLTKRSDGVSAAIHTRYSEQFLTDLKKHNDQYPKIQFIHLSHRNHDRFLIIDDKVFFMGASLKDMGTGLCAVSEISITPEIILGLLE